MSTSHPLLAAVYDGALRLAEREFIQPMRRRALAGIGGDVLDLGAGTGANFPVLAETGARITAVEPDPHMLRRARRRAGDLGMDVRFAAAPAEELPFPDASFDAVAAMLVLCTVRDPARALAEVARVLRPGGEVRFVEHVRAEGHAAAWQDRLRPLWSACAGGCQLNRDTGSLLRARFARADWDVVRVPFPLCRVLVGHAR